MRGPNDKTNYCPYTDDFLGSISQRHSETSQPRVKAIQNILAGFHFFESSGLSLMMRDFCGAIWGKMKPVQLTDYVITSAVSLIKNRLMLFPSSYQFHSHV